jgi:hypothetical protein
VWVASFNRTTTRYACGRNRRKVRCPTGRERPRHRRPWPLVAGRENSSPGYFLPMRSDLVASSFFAFLSPFAAFLAATCLLPSLIFTAQFPDLLPPGQCFGRFQLLGLLKSLRALARFLRCHLVSPFLRIAFSVQSTHSTMNPRGPRTQACLTLPRNPSNNACNLRSKPPARVWRNHSQTPHGPKRLLAQFLCRCLIGFLRSLRCHLVSPLSAIALGIEPASSKANPYRPAARIFSEPLPHLSTKP